MRKLLSVVYGDGKQTCDFIFIEHIAEEKHGLLTDDGVDGVVRLKDTQLVDLDGLDYSRLAGADTYLIELVTPFVLQSEYPNATITRVPWWWAETHDELRTRDEKILDQREVFRLQTVDHAQRTTYHDNRPVETTKTASGESAHILDTGSANSTKTTRRAPGGLHTSLNTPRSRTKHKLNRRRSTEIAYSLPICASSESETSSSTTSKPNYFSIYTRR